MGGDFTSLRSKVLFYLFIVLFIFLTLFPLLWVLKLSIISQAELQRSPPTIFPHSLSFASYGRVFANGSFTKGIINSFVIAGFTTVICLAVGSIAAYALARIKFSFQLPVSSLILAIAFFPAVAIIAPLFLQFTRMGLVNTYWAMILPDTLLSLPLTVYLLVAYFRELPASIEEAAKVDGAGTLQTFWRVTLPLSIPGVVTTGLLTFIFAWNEFLFANTFAFDASTQPATVVIPLFASQFTTDYGAQAAASIIVTLPLVILVFLFQRRIVSGLTAGATSG
ncbi:MAG TPA: carbohydrate ABC transporter permease [Actinomycetota bacterium]|jgi:ABC-type glycerol-3-phosphate transport system permease component|nr:carbohydrate ABC transporter permease [Actinomycetota bacterium]